MSFTACDCSECQAMCQRRPCWPTPLDAQRLIAAGYADRLMIDWWFDRAQNKTVYVLTPAIAGRESGESPAHPAGRCTFLNENNLCQLHDLDLKPTEGRIALCHDRSPTDLHERMGQTWDGDDGRSVIDRWEADPPRGRRLVFVAHSNQRRKLRRKE
jgi:hypothetical protein